MRVIVGLQLFYGTFLQNVSCAFILLFRIFSQHKLLNLTQLVETIADTLFSSCLFYFASSDCSLCLQVHYYEAINFYKWINNKSSIYQSDVVQRNKFSFMEVNKTVFWFFGRKQSKGLFVVCGCCYKIHQCVT